MTHEEEVDAVSSTFDAQYYLSEYPDVNCSIDGAVHHFCKKGWREGRNPNPFFDTTSYLLVNTDIAEANINPYSHFVRFGQYESRFSPPSKAPSFVAALLFGYPVFDWVERIRPHIDIEYYRNILEDMQEYDIDLAAHFAFKGWREGLSPNNQFDVTEWLRRYPVIERLGVNPLLVHVEAMAGRFAIEGLKETGLIARSFSAESVNSSDRANGFRGAAELKAIEPEFSEFYYLENYPEIKSSGVDPLTHYFYIGWREGRNPCGYFDTRYYLETNQDVREAAIEPFWHYLVAGKAEGRLALPPAGYDKQQEEFYASDQSAADLAADLLHDESQQLAFLKRQFSSKYYLKTYSDVAEAGIDPLMHYFYTGWREGRNPCKTFDTRYYLKANPDVRASGVEPFGHYLAIGKAEGRLGTRPEGVPESLSEANANQRAMDLAEALQQDEYQRMEIVRSGFSSAHYLETHLDVAEAGIDPLSHYFYTGWREGRNPCMDFDVSYYLNLNADVRELGVEPFWHYLVIGKAEGRAGSPGAGNAAEPEANQTFSDLVAGPVQDDTEKLDVIKREFSPSYYLNTYPDVAEAGIDPLTHYFQTGWREGRNPCKAFDAKYYLSANQDVREAGIEPFWHYLVAGRAEGRLGRRPGGYRREIIEAALDPTRRTESYVAKLEGARLSQKQLLQKLTRLFKGREGLVVSLSHDSYIGVVGGTQIFVADEQARFNERNHAYLHLSPVVARLEFAPEDSEQLVRLIADGELLGYVELHDLIKWFPKSGGSSLPNVLLVIHSVFGFAAGTLCDLFAVVKPQRSLFWTHDYSSICPGFNLLRNDVEYCGAPPVDSMACRVCVYGPSRAGHLERMERLFTTCNFDVLSPSEFTLDLWRRTANLPCRTSAVHHHWEIEPKPEKKPRRNAAIDRSQVSLAFIGFPSAHKGWPIFSDLVDRLDGDERYRFVHFVANTKFSLESVTKVETAVTPNDRLAAVRLLNENHIDFVLMLATWPETFSFVAYEAIAAGAHLICLPESGNVADLVRRTGRGLVLPDSAAITEFLVSGEAVQYAAEFRQKKLTFKIDNVGTSATVDGIFAVSE